METEVAAPPDPFLNMNDWEEDAENMTKKVFGFWKLDEIPAFAAALDQPEVTGEWHIVRSDPACPELDHKSDNPFNFLPAEKLDSIIRFMKKQQVDDKKLSAIEKVWLGHPKIRKILVKVIHNGLTPLERNRNAVWFRVATCSAIAQSGGMVTQFNRSTIAIDPMKPGYRWIIVPVRDNDFQGVSRSGHRN